MRYYFRILRTFVTNSAQQEVEYRVDFLLNLINVILSTGASVAILLVMFAHRNSIGGWALAEVLILMGLFRICKSYIEVFIMPNVGRIPEHVRRGELDLLLLKPTDSQFLVSCRHVDFWRIPEGLVGIALVLIGWISQGLEFSLVRVGSAAISLVAGATILYAIWLLLMTASFWFVDIRNLPVILNVAFEFAQFPASAFPSSLKFALLFVLPIAFVTTVPASAIMGRLEPATALTGIALAALMLVLSRLFWRYAIRRYTSASS